MSESFAGKARRKVKARVDAFRRGKGFYCRKGFLIQNPGADLERGMRKKDAR